MSDDRLAAKPIYENNDLMRYPRGDADEALREKALGMALKYMSLFTAVPGITLDAPSIVHIAGIFEAFLRGDADEAEIADLLTGRRLIESSLLKAYAASVLPYNTGNSDINAFTPAALHDKMVAAIDDARTATARYFDLLLGPASSGAVE